MRLRISRPVEHVLPSQQAILFTDLDRTQICEAFAVDICCEGVITQHLVVISLPGFWARPIGPILKVHEVQEFYFS
jgi:hypothetical protein